MSKLTLVLTIVLCAILGQKLVLGYPADPEAVEVAAPAAAVVEEKDAMEPSETFGFGFYPGWGGPGWGGYGGEYGYGHRYGHSYGHRHWNYGSSAWGYRHPPIYPVWG